MNETLATVITIFCAALLMFIFPLMSISERNDDIAQSVVQTATDKIADKVSVSGLIKPSDYEAYEKELAATGNTYDIEIEVQHLDENPERKKVATTSADAIGENVRYSTFTSDILDTMYPSSGVSANYKLKKGDNVIFTVKNTNTTLAQSLRSFFYKITGQGTYQVAASSSSMVINTGK